jgi:hypothetical protein
MVKANEMLWQMERWKEKDEMVEENICWLYVSWVRAELLG